MKNLKKVLAFVVVFTMVCGLSVFASPYSDVADDATYAEAVTMLSSLGILEGYEDGTFKPEGTITRAEFAAVTVRLLGAEDSAQGAIGGSQFTDVPDDQWFAGYVNYAASLGIINGMGDGTFAPQEPVKYQEAVKMLVCMLGYEPMAQVKGGWPNGYLAVASTQVKITKGATAESTAPASRAIVARLAFNSLEAPLMEQSNWNPNDPEFAITDKTILKDYLEIDKIEGVITENYLTNAVSNGVDKDDDDVKVEVSRLNDEAEEGTKTIAEGETNASDYLGYTVVAYVTDLEESDPTFLAVTPKAGYNQTLKVDLSNFDSASEGSKSVSVKYWKDRDADKKVSTLYTNAEDVLTITNNKSESLDGADVAALFGDKGYNAETTKDGNIVFIDNDKDDKYDTMIITEFGANYVVKTIDAAKNKITAESGSSLTLDVESEDQYVTIVKDGKTIEFDDIATGDVITLVSDATTVKNSKVVTAYVSSNRIDGKITGATRDGYYKIDGKGYKAANTLSDSDLKVGTTGTFYLNVNDKIVYVGDSATAGSGTYGYLYAAGKENTFSSGGKDVILFEMLTQEGKWTRFELDSKVRFIQEDKGIDERISDTNPAVDLTKYMPNVFSPEIPKDETIPTSVAGDTFVLTIGDGAYKDRVIKFDQKDGVITRIYLPTENGDEFGYEDDDTEYRADGTYFKGGSALDENTTIFAFSGEYGDKKSVTVTSASIFKDGENYSYRGFEDDGDAYKAIVAKVAENTVTSDNRFIVVSDIILTSNEDDDEVYEIQGFQGADGEVDDAFSIMTNTNWDDAGFIEDNDFGVNDVEDLQPGDVIIVNTDASGDVSKIKVLMTADAALVDSADSTFYEVDDTNANKPVVDAFGYVYKKVSNRISLALEVEIDDEDNVKGIAPDEDMEFTIGGSKFKGNIYLVDLTTSKTRISISDIGEIEPNNAVVDNGKTYPAYMTYVRTVDGTVIDVVVYAVDGSLMENIEKSTTAPTTSPEASPAPTTSPEASQAPTTSPEASQKA